MNYRTRIIYGSQSENVAYVNERPDYVNNQPNQVVVADVSVIEQICPISPITGFRDNDLARLFSPATSAKEKEFILNSFSEVKGKSSPQDLTDDELMQLIPPRYLNDATEISRYMDMIKEVFKEIQPVDDDEEPQSVEEPVTPTPSETSEPTSHL